MLLNTLQISCVELLVQTTGPDDVGSVVSGERSKSAIVQTDKAIGQNENLAYEVILLKRFLIHVSICDQVCVNFDLDNLLVDMCSTDSISAMLQSSRCTEERAELHHKRSTRVLNSEFHRRQIECIVREAARTRSSLLRARCRLRGIIFLNYPK